MEYMLSTARKHEFASEFRERLENGISLPPLPQVAKMLLELRGKPDACTSDLSAVIEKDPAIATQVVRYARMSSFGYGDRIKTIEDAVQLVLGFNRALHMAMGLSAAGVLKMPREGRLGCDAFWDHALHTAILTQSLARELPKDKAVDAGICYLAGLAHDIGFLLLGHLYPQEFATLSKLIDKCAGRDLRELEYQCLGLSHDMIGLCLMKSWNMPEEIIVAVGEHHFPDYGGKHAIYAKLVYLANKLLIPENHSFGESTIGAHLHVDLTELGLSDEQIDRAMLSVRNLSPELTKLAGDLAA